MRLRERKKAVLRDTIVRNAVSLFLERGYDAVSLEEIVAVSMCSRSTFHRYFGAKEDLLFPTAGDRLTAVRAALESADPAADPWVGARQAVTAGLCGFLDDLPTGLRSSIIRLWFSEAAPRRRYLEIVLEWETALSDYLAPHLGVTAEPSLECQLLASLVSSALRAALNTAMQTGDDVEKLANRAFDLVESGLSAQLRALRRSTLGVAPGD